MNFVYQRVHVLDRQPLHLGRHLDLAARALREIYGIDCRLDEVEVARRIAVAVRGGRISSGAFGGAAVPPRGSAVVLLRFWPADEQAEDHFSSQNFSGPRPPLGGPLTTFSESRDDGNVDFSVVPERTLLTRGYAHSSLRPAAVTFDYSIPWPHLPTGFGLAAAALFDDLANRPSRHTTRQEANLSSEADRFYADRSFEGGDSTKRTDPTEKQEGVKDACLSRQMRSVRRNGEHLISCGDAPLFAIRGRRLVTPAIVDGAMGGALEGALDGALDSVERRLVIAAVTEASLAGSVRSRSTGPLRLELVEEPILRSELTTLDELFFADAAGITSLSECDGAKFTALVAPKIAAAIADSDLG